MKCVIVFYDPWKGSASQGEMDPGIWDFPLFRMSRASLGCPSCQYPDNDRMTLSDSCCLCAAQVGPMQTACLAACQVCPWGGMDGRKLKNIEKRSVFWKLVVYLIWSPLYFEIIIILMWFKRDLISILVRHGLLPIDIAFWNREGTFMCLRHQWHWWKWHFLSSQPCTHLTEICPSTRPEWSESSETQSPRISKIPRMPCNPDTQYLVQRSHRPA